MPRRTPLPSELHRQPFRIDEATATGVGEGRLRGKDLEQPFHGVRSVRPDVPPATELDAVLFRCRQFEPILGTTRFFSHLTAARLWNLPLPTAYSASDPLDISVVAPNRAPNGAGVRGHQTHQAIVVVRHGLPMSDPISTWTALAPLLFLDDLVAVGDAIVLDPPVLDPRDIRPYATVETFLDRTRAITGRGARAIRAARALIRQGAESRPETLLRLLILASGLPEPELNIELRDAAGRLLGRVDMAFPEWRVVVEYDGDQHRTSSQQYERDISRIEGLANAGWTIIRVRSHGLFADRNGTAERIRHALVAAGWRQ